MANISIKLNLTQLKSVKKVMKRKDGSQVECLVLPIDSNNLFRGEKGLYIDLTAIEIKNKVGDSKDTHLVKQSFDKETYNAMSDEDKKKLPILGNAILWGRQEPEPVIAEELNDLPNDDENDALPF